MANIGFPLRKSFSLKNIAIKKKKRPQSQSFRQNRALPAAEKLKYQYYESTSVNKRVSFKITSIQGYQNFILPPFKGHDECKKISTVNELCEKSLVTVGFSSHIVMEVRLYVNGTSFSGTIKLSLSSLGSPITFPVNYSDLGSDAFIEICLYDVLPTKNRLLLSRIRLQLFSGKGILKMGNYNVRYNKTADELRENYKFFNNIETIKFVGTSAWLNKKVSHKLKEYILKREYDLKNRDLLIDDDILVNVSLPVFKYCVIHPSLFKVKFKKTQEEEEIETSSKKKRRVPNSLKPQQWQKTGRGHKKRKTFFDKKDKPKKTAPSQEITDIKNKNYLVIEDLEVNQTNPVEEKHFKLFKLYKLSPFDSNAEGFIKPNTNDLKKIQQIIDLTPLDPISLSQKYHLWKYRHYLLSQPKALVKFLKTVQWSDEKENELATSLIDKWSPIDYIDALELLGYFFANNKIVREYAVKMISQLKDEILLQILLQLVQSLRYERSIIMKGKNCQNSALCVLLIKRACANFEIANFLYWYLKTEFNDMLYKDLYEKVHHVFLVKLLKSNRKDFYHKLEKQREFVEELRKVRDMMKKMGRIDKIKKLKEELSKPKWETLFTTKMNMDCLDLLVLPNIQVVGFDVSKIYVYKSHLNPFLIPMKVKKEPGDTSKSHKLCRIIYKTGNDLRQGQLVIHIISLMDQILKRNALDLKITPYEILPCSTFDGFVQCVYPCESMYDIFYSQKTTIISWLKAKSKNDTEFRIACDNFIRSCAGYSVITYILGIGDRHLENILLRENGQMFHIDFDYILGRDPKPYPPSMKISPEMVKALKAMKTLDNKVGYTTFVELCCNSYNLLRSNSNLILNLFVLMLDSNIPDLIAKGSRNPLQNLNKIKEKFKLNFSDNEAIISLRGIIEDSEKALFSKINEGIHRIAQYWRE